MMVREVEGEHRARGRLGTTGPPRALSFPPEALVGDRWGSLSRRTEPLVIRFSRLVARGKPEECWPWHGRLTDGGAPCFTIGGRYLQGRRVAWVLAHRRELPATTRISMKCGQPTCLNPAHMRPQLVVRARSREHRLRLERARVAQVALAAGMSVKSVARVLGISRPTVRELKNVETQAETVHIERDAPA